MATRTIAFRLNDKNREDKEIMEWLDKAVYEGEYYDSLTEAVKWAILCFVRGEIRFREEMSTMELMQEFVRDFAKQSRIDTEKLMQEATNKILAGVLASMNMQADGYSPVPIQGYTVPQMEALMQIPTKPIAVSGQEQPEEEAGLGKSEVPLDASTKASLAAMFGDDD